MPVHSLRQISRGKPTASGIHAVDSSSPRVRESQAAGCYGSGHIEDQKCAHTVIAEAFPHLREKECAQPSRMANLFGHFSDLTTVNVCDRVNDLEDEMKYVRFGLLIGIVLS